MTKRRKSHWVELDRRRLLGFDQARVVDGKAPTAAKVGSKDPGLRNSLSLGGNLDAKVGQKEFLGRLPAGISAKVGFKNN